MGIGQGDVTATPMQIARATAAIANGGKLVTPHVAKEVLGPDGDIRSSSFPAQGGDLLSPVWYGLGEEGA